MVLYFKMLHFTMSLSVLMRKEKRSAVAEALITDLPCYTIIYSFFYLEPSDLFYTIPLVCRRFRNSLYKICNNKSSGNSFVDNFSRTNENTLAKTSRKSVSPKYIGRYWSASKRYTSNRLLWETFRTSCVTTIFWFL